jgi:hypothetical protein
MTTITFDVTAFRAAYPAFSNATTYPDATLQGYWDAATSYISDQNSGCLMLRDGARVLALNLMTAHLAALFAIIAAGETPGIETSATIDKISVQMMPPPVKNQWQFWLSQTPYGAQLLALLQANTAGGFYAGGMGELGAFRRIGGAFVP